MKVVVVGKGDERWAKVIRAAAGDNGVLWVEKVSNICDVKRLLRRAHAQCFLPLAASARPRQDRAQALRAVQLHSRLVAAARHVWVVDDRLDRCGTVHRQLVLVDVAPLQWLTQMRLIALCNERPDGTQDKNYCQHRAQKATTKAHSRLVAGLAAPPLLSILSRDKAKAKLLCKCWLDAINNVSVDWLLTWNWNSLQGEKNDFATSDWKRGNRHSLESRKSISLAARHPPQLTAKCRKSVFTFIDRPADCVQGEKADCFRLLVIAMFAKKKETWSALDKN